MGPTGGPILVAVTPSLSRFKIESALVFRQAGIA
jgi:hypothetical protein